MPEPRQPASRLALQHSPARVVLLGFGVVGRGVLRAAARRPGLDVVGIIVRRPELDGSPATELVAEAPAGLRLSTDGPAVLAATRPDVVLVATRSTLLEVLPHLRLAASTGVAVACTAEELAYIEPDDGPQAAAIFALSQERQVPIVALGLNPGFLLDVWPLMLANIAADIESIEAVRIVDVSGFGPQVRASLGIGHSPAGFEEGLAAGRIGGHRGFRESLRLIGAALGRPVDATTVETLPIMAQRDRSLPDGAIRKGQTAGVSQVATGSTAGQQWLRVEMTASVALDELDAVPIDRIHIVGNPDLTATIAPSAPSVGGTIARLVNALPAVPGTPVGVHSTLALGITPPWTAARSDP
jgi:4-hydroxy-tetrahydrodipicolinate reductase